MSGVPGPVNRILTLALGPGYFWVLAVMLSQQAQIPMTQALISVFVGGFVLVCICIALSVRLVEADSSDLHRWSLQTMFLILVGFAVVLSYLGPFISAPNQRLTIGSLIDVFFLLLIYGAMTVIVVVRFSETLLTLTLTIVKKFRRKRA